MFRLNIGIRVDIFKFPKKKFSKFSFLICSYSVGYIISEVSSSIICISGWVIQIHEIHHTFQANRPKPFWWCILELKLPLGLMECHHGVIWPWFDSTDQNNRQQMSHLEYWNQILVHPFSSSRTHGFRITSKLNITSCRMNHASMHVPDGADPDRRPGGQPTPGLDSGLRCPRAVILMQYLFRSIFYSFAEW